MQTRDAILDAAGTLFADRGYRDTSIREICSEADANIAAVNYHFGNKAGLYREVMDRAYRELGNQAPMPTLQSAADGRSALSAWINWYLDRIFGEGSELTSRLLLREAASPTSALDTLVEERLHPVYQGLEEIVRALLPEASNQRVLKLHCLSILGQCLVHRTSKEMIDRLPVEPRSIMDDRDGLAAHIVSCAIAALDGQKTTLPADEVANS